MADFYVSPDGNDSWTGTKETPALGKNDGPFATLARARDAVRDRLISDEAKTEDDIVVQMRGGTYALGETVVFGPEDSGTASRKVIYEAYPGETPVLSGGRAIESWEKLTDISLHPDGLSNAALTNVWVADLPRNRGESWRFSTLYQQNDRLPRARSDGFIPIVEKDGDEDSLLADNRTVRYPEGAICAQEHPEDMELHIIPKFPWFHNILPLESVDENSQTARTQWAASYPMEPVAFLRNAQEPSAWFENSFGALTKPGEWVLDAANGRLYLWPTEGEPGNDIVAPVLCELIRIEGDESADRIVSNIAIRGISFTHGDRYRPDDGRRYAYAMSDVPNALVRFNGAESCSVENCRFEQSGDTGLRLDFHCMHMRVAGNTFCHLGGVGLMLCGHREITKPDVNKHNEVADNEIHHCGEIRWSATGLFIQQSGENHIHHNSVHDLPHNGIMLGGLTRPSRDELLALGIEPPDSHPDPVEAYRRALRFIPARNNLIEHNEIYQVMNRLGDGNGMYINGAGAGNIVRRNCFRDITGYGCQSALRTDDHQSGTTMRENLIYRCVGGGITLKQINDIENNIVACLLPKVLPDGTVIPPDGYILLRRGPSGGSRISKNILYQSRDPVQFYCEGKIKRWPLAFVRECRTDYNVYWCTVDREFCETYLSKNREEGIDGQSLVTDPLFENAEDGDFRLKPDSPALDLGFIQFDLDDFGRRETK